MSKTKGYFVSRYGHSACLPHMDLGDKYIDHPQQIHGLYQPFIIVVGELPDWLDFNKIYQIQCSSMLFIDWDLLKYGI